MLAALKFLREGPLDVFARSADRRQERELRDVYLQTMRKVSETLPADGLAWATALAEVPRQVRGFGCVKEPAIRAALAHLREALARGEAQWCGGSREDEAT